MIEQFIDLNLSAQFVQERVFLSATVVSNEFMNWIKEEKKGGDHLMNIKKLVESGQREDFYIGCDKLLRFGERLYVP